MEAAIARAEHCPARRELQREGREVGEAQMLVSGWAARFRTLPNGRRQLLSFLLPGDFFNLYDHPRPLAMSSITALCEVSACVVPPRGTADDLDELYSRSRALEEAILLAQITRLGRLNAQERITDLLLELNQRLECCGLAESGTFAMPITQEILSEALGLTTVHLNRTLQAARKAGQVEWRAGQVTIPEPIRFTLKTGRHGNSVTA